MQLPDGAYVNHGSYTVTYPNGKLALSGKFEQGKKEGVWSEYNEKGEKIAERYFEGGVERAQPSSGTANSR
jgi:antitoxin component YwqK of YwqJK toxin-antitoxin module